ncbi:hypothetical protein Fmac_008532 [Flemingia macrophylla]|uniref:non-specific serine/threonine protein kinase n=1 Tax=Flemingia macrophylla TaxID=520843 RepID=A0ABD1MYJ6_9FABA
MVLFGCEKACYRMLDPNPRTRISVVKIMQSSWFIKDYVQNEAAQLPRMSPTEEDISNVQHAFTFSWYSYLKDSLMWNTEENPKKLYHFNAFDLISLSSGFHISGLFKNDKNDKRLVRFTTRKPPPTIVSMLKAITLLDGGFKV